MLNILVPLAGGSVFFDQSEYVYPKPLIEVNGKTMIERFVENLNKISEEKKFIFVLNSSDCDKFHLDQILKLLTSSQCIIIKLNNETKGAACSALMALEYINNDDALIISNADQIIDHNLDEAIQYFNREQFDAATLCFESVHPRWSFVKLNDAGYVIETTEKRPISKMAIAGFYYYKHGRSFVQSAMKSIEKGSSIDNKYYISPTFNEMILENKKIGIYTLDSACYHTFYSPQKLKEYESLLSQKS